MRSTLAKGETDVALPPLPANNTSRYFVEYSDGYNPHVLVVRALDPRDDANADAAISGFLTALVPALPEAWQVTGARYQGGGTDFSLPVSLPLTLAVTGTTGLFLDGREAPRQHTWTGRSLQSGRDTRVGIFGLVIATPATYRWVTLAPGSPLADALQALRNAQSAGIFCAIDGGDVLWNEYVNVNYNSYWETEARQ